MTIHFLLRKRGFALCMNSSFFGFFAHAGFLHGLSTLGLRPVAVAGASAGALTGGFYAAGNEPAKILRILEDANIMAAFREWGATVRALGTLANRGGYTGVLSGRRALDLFRRYLGDQRIEDCRPRFALSVANLTSASSDIIERGPLAEFVLASCAVPGMFQARHIDGSHYWDGGVADPVPFEHWLDDDDIRTIVLHLVVNPDELQPPRAHAFYGGLVLCHRIASDEIFRLKLRLAEQAGKRVIVLRTVAPRPGPGKLHLGPRCVELGKQTALANRKELEKLK